MACGLGLLFLLTTLVYFDYVCFGVLNCVCLVDSGVWFGLYLLCLVLVDLIGLVLGVVICVGGWFVCFRCLFFVIFVWFYVWGMVVYLVVWWLFACSYDVCFVVWFWIWFVLAALYCCGLTRLLLMMFIYLFLFAFCLFRLLSFICCWMQLCLVSGWV